MHRLIEQRQLNGVVGSFSSDCRSLNEDPIIRICGIMAYSGVHVALDSSGVPRVDMELLNCEVIQGFDIKHVAGFSSVFCKESGQGDFRTDVLIEFMGTNIPQACVVGTGVLIVTATVVYTFRTKGYFKGVGASIIAEARVGSTGVLIVTATVVYAFPYRTQVNVKDVGANKVANVPCTGVVIITIRGGAEGNSIKIVPHFCPDAVDMGSIIRVSRTNGLAANFRVIINRIGKSLNASATTSLEVVAKTNGERRMWSETEHLSLGLNRKLIAVSLTYH
jgi:hypothetical protein